MYPLNAKYIIVESILTMRPCSISFEYKAIPEQEEARWTIPLNRSSSIWNKELNAVTIWKGLARRSAPDYSLSVSGSESRPFAMSDLYKCVRGMLKQTFHFQIMLTWPIYQIQKGACAEGSITSAKRKFSSRRRKTRKEEAPNIEGGRGHKKIQGTVVLFMGTNLQQSLQKGVFVPRRSRERLESHTRMVSWLLVLKNLGSSRSQTVHRSVTLLAFSVPVGRPGPEAKRRPRGIVMLYSRRGRDKSNHQVRAAALMVVQN